MSDSELQQPLSASETEQSDDSSLPDWPLSNDDVEPDDAAIVSDAPFISTSLRSLHTGNIQDPETPLFCIAQANEESLVGSLSADTEGFALQLTIDAGSWDLPRMQMDVFCNGTDGPLTVSTRWTLGDIYTEEFRIREIKFHRVADCPGFVDIANPDVLAACETDEEKNRLVCVWMRTRPKPGPQKIRMRGEYDENVKSFLSILFTNRRRYHLRIWFIAPCDLDDFKEQCLVYFLLFLELRINPVHYWYQSREQETRRANQP